MDSINEPQKPIQVVVAKAEKNLGIAVVLAAIFGPLGLFYASIPQDKKNSLAKRYALRGCLLSLCLLIMHAHQFSIAGDSICEPLLKILQSDKTIRVGIDILQVQGHRLWRVICIDGRFAA